jgi:hypothetical protein
MTYNLLKMIPTRYITKTAVFWIGVALVALGVAVAAVAFYSLVRARNSPYDAEVMAEELRANGVIVENYYKVLGSSYHPPVPQSPPVSLGGYIAAGVLVVAGVILILKAPSFPSNRHSMNRNQEPEQAVDATCDKPES